ncbi:N-acetylmuramoyl-L-alanine amidase family protein [Cohnella kolymensis]|uniref:N-acetylmuramoyl-L-alanine amidase family protein n=1 Tax=Cohnella kolymensis TaxID=1590652 RepID=UPI001F1EACBE|nr:N-acetylmuramoyl-L-alanine amidase [Cohnella kolymensis]
MRRALLLCCALLLFTGWKAPDAGDKDVVGAEPPNIKRALPSADVVIDAGHGGIDGGTYWRDIKEKDINLAIARKLYLLLRSKGIRTILNRTGDYALSDDNRWHATRSRHRRDLSQRKSLANEIDAPLFVSIHVNWSTRGRARGPVTIHQSEGRSALLAGFIQNSLNQQQGRHRLPKPTSKLYLLKKTEVPSVLVETAFLSDPQDRAMLTSSVGQTRIASAIASGIIAYLCFAP